MNRIKAIANSLTVKIFACFFVLILACVCSVGYTFYQNSYNLLEENTYSLLDSILVQLKERIDVKINDSLVILQRIEYDAAFRRIVLQNYKSGYSSYYKDVESVGTSLHSLRDDNSQLIDSIYFYNGNGLVLYTINFSPVTGILSRNQIWEIYESRKTDAVHFRMVHEDEIFSSTTFREVLTIFNVVDSRAEKQKYFLGINLSKEAFLQELNHADFGETGYVALVGDGVFLPSDNYKNTYGFDANIIKVIQESAQDNDWIHVVNEEGEVLLLKIESLKNSGWKLVAVMPETELYGQIDGKLQDFFYVVIVTIIAGLVLSILLARSVTKPIQALTKKINEIEYGELVVDFDTKAGGEVGVLADCLNRLVRQVGQLLVEVKEKESQRRRYELSIVQAQINPHFLYNTLASLKSLVQYDERDRAAHMIDMLIQFFRTGLGRGKMVVALKEEMAHVSSYLEVQSMRYGDKFSYQIEAADEVLGADIIKLTIQPLVENALYHGLKEQDEPGLILISARKEQDKLTIIVFDDGKGIPAKKLEQIKAEIEKNFQDNDTETTYGLRNVHQRIKLKYGDGYGLKIQSVEGEYTQITMSIPYILGRRIKGDL